MAFPRAPLNHPDALLGDQKMIHLLKEINVVFKSKGKPLKQKDDIVHFLEDDEEPDHWQQMRQGCVPGLVVTRKNGSMVLIGKDIFLSFKEGEIVQAVVAFVATFYLLDLDYPAKWLMSLSVLQKIIFNDNQMHPDCSTAELKKILEDLDIVY
ncbi:Hypothetical predicted protein [Paramuricea clavata]|uniref:Uncharacterized protein n=1 Tax=Paramuricea clavata TaxID=317549 RepID=A0A6S7I612_PARCT|nr:Hypothetical predicted protein [Paramuricea clavata]CAB4042295.1 Hypothetical predicted protein [Paramuricea clavata]